MTTGRRAPPDERAETGLSARSGWQMGQSVLIDSSWKRIVFQPGVPWRVTRPRGVRYEVRFADGSSFVVSADVDDKNYFGNREGTFLVRAIGPPFIAVLCVEP